MSQTTKKTKGCPYDPRTTAEFDNFIYVIQYYADNGDTGSIKNACALRRAKIASEFGFITDNVKCPAPGDLPVCQSCPFRK